MVQKKTPPMENTILEIPPLSHPPLTTETTAFSPFLTTLPNYCSPTQLPTITTTHLSPYTTFSNLVPSYQGMYPSNGISYHDNQQHQGGPGASSDYLQEIPVRVWMDATKTNNFD